MFNAIVKDLNMGNLKTKTAINCFTVPSEYWCYTIFDTYRYVIIIMVILFFSCFSGIFRLKYEAVTSKIIINNIGYWDTNLPCFITIRALKNIGVVRGLSSVWDLSSVWGLSLVWVLTTVYGITRLLDIVEALDQTRKLYSVGTIIRWLCPRAFIASLYTVPKDNE